MNYAHKNYDNDCDYFPNKYDVMQKRFFHNTARTENQHTPSSETFNLATGLGSVNLTTPLPRTVVNDSLVKPTLDNTQRKVERKQWSGESQLVINSAGTNSCCKLNKIKKDNGTQTEIEDKDAEINAVMPKKTEEGSDQGLMTMQESQKLECEILKSNEEAELKSFALRQLLKTNSRETDSVLCSIYDCIFVKRVQPTTTLNFNVKIAGTGQMLKCHIDTGTNYSFIAEHLVKNCKLQKNHLPSIAAANNQQLAILGRIHRTLLICDKPYNVEFLVVKELALNIIIGNRFLIKNLMEISFKDRLITIFDPVTQRQNVIPIDESWLINLIKTETLSSLKEVQEEEKLLEIRAEMDQIIKARQHVRIMEIQQRGPNLELEANVNLQERSKLHAYISTDFSTGKRYISVYNAGISPKMLKKNALIGYLQMGGTLSTNVGVDEGNQRKELKGKCKMDYGSLHPYKIEIFDNNGDAFKINPELSVVQHNRVVQVLKKPTLDNTQSEK